MKDVQLDRRFVLLALDVICFAGLVAFALKFYTYITHLVYLPVIPNIFDVFFIIITACFLFWRIQQKGKHHE